MLALKQENQAFAGIKVLAITRILGSPFAAYQLALHGAEVIQIEDPKGGDHARVSGGAHAQKLIRAGLAHGFLAHGSNKKSLTLNLSDPAGQQAFKELAKGADVIIENLRVGTMQRYGLAYEHITQ